MHIIFMLPIRLLITCIQPLDYRAHVGLQSCQTIQLSDYPAVGLQSCRTIELLDYPAVGLQSCRKGGSRTGAPGARPPVLKKFRVCFCKFWLYYMHILDFSQETKFTLFILFTTLATNRYGMCEGASKHPPDLKILPRPPPLKFLDPPLLSVRVFIRKLVNSLCTSLIIRLTCILMINIHKNLIRY